MAKASTLTDAFAAKDTGKWTYSSTAITADGTANFPAQAVGVTTYLTQTSVADYDLTADAISVEVVAHLDGTNTAETTWGVRYAGGNEHTFFVEGSSGSTKRLVFRRQENGGGQSDTSLTFSATDHRYWQLREAAGQVHYETSPDRTTWTIRRSVVSLTGLATTKVLFTVGNYGAANTPTGTAKFDNLNTSGGVVVGTSGPTILRRSADGTTWERRKLLKRNTAGTGWDWI